MGRTLARTVVIDGTVYVKGTELPSDVEVDKDNPKLFEGGDLPTPVEQIEADEKAAEERREAAEAEAEQAEKDEQDDAKPARPARSTASKKD